MELISREKALKVFGNIHSLDYNAQAYKSKIEKIPTIESRPKGKWIIQRGCEEVTVMCSNCRAKDYIPTTIDGRFYFNRNYCWDCGAKMRGYE